VWVDYGPSFIPNADVRSNVCCPQPHQSQLGQLETFGRHAQISRKQSLPAFELAHALVRTTSATCNAAIVALRSRVV